MAYVYRYTDLEDLLIKYVGIVYGETRTLQQRLNEHKNNDAWCKNKNWRIEYFYVNTRTDAECLEAHFIALYKTYNYYNLMYHSFLKHQKNTSAYSCHSDIHQPK